MARRSWTREQDLAVLYVKLTHGNEFRSNPDLRNLAATMERTTAALLMRKANFDSSYTTSRYSTLSVQPFLRVIGPQLLPVWHREGREGQDVRRGVRQHLRHLGKGLPELFHHSVQSAVDLCRRQLLLSAPCFWLVLCFQNHYPRCTGALSYPFSTPPMPPGLRYR